MSPRGGRAAPPAPCRTGCTSSRPGGGGSAGRRSPRPAGRHGALDHLTTVWEPPAAVGLDEDATVVAVHVGVDEVTSLITSDSSRSPSATRLVAPRSGGPSASSRPLGTNSNAGPLCRISHLAYALNPAPKDWTRWSNSSAPATIGTCLPVAGEPPSSRSRRTAVEHHPQHDDRCCCAGRRRPASVPRSCSASYARSPIRDRTHTPIPDRTHRSNRRRSSASIGKRASNSSCYRRPR